MTNPRINGLTANVQVPIPAELVAPGARPRLVTQRIHDLLVLVHTQLANGGKTIRELAESTGEKPDAVYQQLRKLRLEGVVHTIMFGARRGRKSVDLWVLVPVEDRKTISASGEQQPVENDPLFLSMFRARGD